MTTVRNTAEDDLFDADYEIRFLAKVDILIEAIPGKALKREFIDGEMSALLHRYSRHECRRRAGVPSDDPDRLQLADFVVLLRALNTRKKAIEKLDG